MSRFFNSLTGRLILLIIAALVVAQALSVLLFYDERRLAVHSAQGLETAGRAANVVHLIEAAPPEFHQPILEAASSPLARFTIDPTPAIDHSDHAVDGAFANRVRDILGGGDTRAVLVELHEAPAPRGPGGLLMRGMGEMHQAMMAENLSASELELSIALTNGRWLNVDTRFHLPPLQWPLASALSFGLTTALLLVAVVWFLLRQITRPLRQLAVAADRLGRGEDGGELPAAGPSEVQYLTRAFDNMRDRLTRHIESRTQILAALGHDLRSPLTGLRVRAELVDDDETRERLVETIEEMQDMVDTTLAYARGVSTREPSGPVALSALLDGIAGEMREAGQAVDIRVEAHPEVSARPVQLKRALRNVMENACRYGERARVTLSVARDDALIEVADDGPGVPVDMLDKLFDPFVRLETSRSRDTGGTGLGLSIAQTVIQAHGGRITLENGPERGLIVKIALPLEPESNPA